MDKNGEVELIKSKINNLILSSPVRVKSEEVFEEVEDNNGLKEFDPREIFPIYIVAEIPRVNINLEFDSYGDIKRRYHRTQVEEVMRRILKVESPISVELLYKRVNYVIGVGRMGTRIKKLYNDILLKRVRSKLAYKRGDTVSKEKIPRLAPIRISTELDRPFLLIPIEELAHASTILIENMGAISEEHLSKNVSRLFYDNTRSGKKILTKMKKVVQYLESNGYIEREQDNTLVTK